MYFGFLNQWNISGAALNRRINTYNYDIIWGGQYRFFDHLYVEFRYGLGLQDMINNVENEYPYYYEFRMGFAF